MELNEAEIQELLSNGNLIVRKDVKWKLKRGLSHFEFQLPVENNFRGNELNLSVIGTKNCHTRDYSYCLLYNKQRIRGIDPYKRHTNNFPQKEVINGTHKHKWNDNVNSCYAYVPTDITNVDNMELTFKQFLRECSINFQGRFNPPPPFQLSMNLEGASHDNL